MAMLSYQRVDDLCWLHLSQGTPWPKAAMAKGLFLEPRRQSGEVRYFFRTCKSLVGGLKHVLFSICSKKSQLTFIFF